MSQEEVLKYIEKIRKPVSMKEISIALCLNHASCSKNLMRLTKSRFIKYEIVFTDKRNIRLYSLS